MWTRRWSGSRAVTLSTIHHGAVAAAKRAAPDLLILAGDDSFGGRMTTEATAEAPLELSEWEHRPSRISIASGRTPEYAARGAPERC